MACLSVTTHRAIYGVGSANHQDGQDNNASPGRRVIQDQVHLDASRHVVVSYGMAITTPYVDINQEGLFGQVRALSVAFGGVGLGGWRGDQIPQGQSGQGFPTGHEQASKQGVGGLARS